MIPDDDSVPATHVHDDDWTAKRFHPDLANTGVAWRAAQPPHIVHGGDNAHTTGRLRACGFCGSMHPSDLAAALAAGASLHWADRKYGWPHKAYVDGVPNPYAGMRNSRTSTGYGSKQGEKDRSTQEYIDRVGGEWMQLTNGFNRDTGEPEYSWHKLDVEGPTTGGKFYSVHLQDATPEERSVIERAMGLYITFDDGKVQWQPWYPKADS